jgi:hypothetical protein
MVGFFAFLLFEGGVEFEVMGVMELHVVCFWKFWFEG